MEKMTVKDRFKKFTKDHGEEIVTLTVVATSVTAFVALVAKTSKSIKESNEKLSQAVGEYNGWADKQNAWIDEQNANGKTVYLLHDASYLTIPNDTPVEWIESV